MGAEVTEEKKSVVLSVEVAGLKVEFRLAKNMTHKAENGSKRNQEKK